MATGTRCSTGYDRRFQPEGPRYYLPLRGKVGRLQALDVVRAAARRIGACLLSSALVVEIGGSLSHAAVVARELGVPCVMGLDAATTRLRTGDRCRVDGSTGEVTPL